MAEAPRNDMLFDRYHLVSSLGRSPWYKQYLAQDTKRGETVALKVIRLPSAPQDRLAEFQAWYADSVLGVPGILPVRAMHLQGEALYVVEQPPEGTPWRNWVGQRHQPGALLPRVKELLERFDELHKRGIVHNCILPDNLWWHPRTGWSVSDCGWLRWCFTHGYAPLDGNPSEAWTAMADGHQLGALFAYTLLGIEITNADLPLRATTELKRRARKLPHPWPNLLLQLWGPAVTEEWSPMAAARLVLEAPPGSPVILTPGSGAPSGGPLPRQSRSEGLPITGSIATAAAISAAAGNPSPQSTSAQIGIPDFLLDDDEVQQIEQAKEPRRRRGEGRRLAQQGVEPDVRTRRRESSRLAAIAFIALLLTLAFAGGILGAMATFLFQDTIRPTEVPDVLGLSVPAAKKVAEPAGFAVVVNQEEYSAEMAAGKIVKQSPNAGTTVKALRDIFVSVSRGARTIKLPSLIGLDEAVAKKNVEKLGLKIGAVNSNYTREAAAGKVIDQEPAPNTLMAKEEPVHLVISKGVLKGEVKMPDVTGEPLADAVAMLSDAKLRLRKVVRRYEGNRPSSRVVLQSPAPGAAVEQGTEVFLTVVAPKSQEPIGEFQVRVATQLPLYDGEREVRITKRDARGTQEVYNKNHTGGDRIEIMVDAYKQTKIEIYVDGRIIREEQY